MKKSHIYKFVACLALLWGCNEEEEFLASSADALVNSPSNLTYNEIYWGETDNLTFGTPDWDGTGPVYFTYNPTRVNSLAYLNPENTTAEDSVILNTTQRGIVSVDRETGLLTLESTNQFSMYDLPYGDYSIGVYANHMAGITLFDKATILHLIELPVELNTSDLGIIPSKILKADGAVGELNASVLANATEVTHGQDIIVDSIRMIEPFVEGISYDTTTNEIFKTSTAVLPGEDTLSFRIYTSIGARTVPVAFEVTPPSLTTSYGEPILLPYATTGVIATTTLGGDDLADASQIEYSILEEVPGISINATTGDISRTNFDAEVGEHSVGVVITTDIGTTIVEDAFTFTVNERIAADEVFFKNEGQEEVTVVTLSPWTAFSGVALNLDTDALGGSNHVYSLRYKDSQGSPVTVSGLSVDAATGALSMDADQNIPEGMYTIDLVINVDGGEIVYENVLDLNYESRWSGNVILEDFSAAPATGATTDFVVAPYNGFQGVYFDGLTMGSWPGWGKQVASGVSMIRVATSAVGKTALIKTLDIDNTKKKVRFSYREAAGPNGWAMGNATNSIQIAGTSYTAPNYVASEWTTIKDETVDDIWSLTELYGAGSGALKGTVSTANDLNLISAEVTIPSNYQDKMYIGLFIDIKGWTIAGITNFSYEFAEAFEAEFTTASE